MKLKTNSNTQSAKLEANPKAIVPQIAESRYKPSLSVRESELLVYLSKGYTTNEISEILYISTDTVETHRKNIMRKLRVANIVAAVAHALRHKLIE